MSVASLSLPAQANTSGRSSLLYNPYQQAFLRALIKRTAGGTWAFDRLSLFAGRRGGKTVIGGVATVIKALDKPNQLLWVCAPTYPDLNDFVMPAVFNQLSVDFIDDYKASFQTLILKNGTRIVFRSLDDPNKGRGPGLDFCWIDETRKVQELAWDTISPALLDRGGQAIFTTSPNAFDWCWRKLWRSAEREEPGYWACKYKTSENPLFATNATLKAALERDRRTMDPLFYQQEYEADFVSFAGRVYNIEDAILRTDDEIRRVFPEWRTLDTPFIDPTRTVMFGLDPGADHPFAGVLLAITEAGLVCLGEHHLRQRPVVEHVRELQKLLARFNPARPFTPDRWVIDRTQRQTAIELSQFGIYASLSDSRVVDGIRRVQSWLAAGQLFFLEPFVPKLIEQMRGYRWADSQRPDGQLRPESVFKENDDLPDALRYAVMAWPELPTVPIAPSAGQRDLSMFAEEQRWAFERDQRISRKERGIEPEEEQDFAGLLAETGGGPLGDFYGTGTRGYYLEDD